ncbi:Ankyrin repeat domain-containing protein [Operophtera brumata]|uniref:Ankyrin repeat domain-containing protein n=1 Tax=Operophtera brumata TaxID=104452 RepID=A0A0L7L997_OPEBR|nr:Ankyrin repeat domain-containing protein [Operophtera brumata]
MPPPTELSYDEILKFMLKHNGKVTNHELVKHFKVFLMNPDKRNEARSTFKKHVNTLAIIKNQNNEKWLILKKKYMTGNGKENETVLESMGPPTADVSENAADAEDAESSQSVPPPRPPLPLQLNQDFSIINNLIHENSPQTPQTPASNDISLNESKESLLSIQSDDVPPKVHPRRKSSEKRSSIPSTPLSIPNQDMSELQETTSSTLSTSQSETTLVDSEQTISVKERKQMFNRMASESDDSFICEILSPPAGFRRTFRADKGAKR